MLPADPKAILLRYLNHGHEAMLWKIEGLSEYDMRRPLTPTGTSLLGILKHVAWVEFGYFGDVFGRPSGFERPVDAGPNADMYADAEETSDQIIALFRQAWELAQSTIEALDLDAEGHVPWWGDNNPVTLNLILGHMTIELQRHLGHMDILREMVDGRIGLLEGNTNLPHEEDTDWPAHVAKLEAIATHAAARAGGA